MPVAALYDIHGNLPALEAVLDEIHAAGVDRVVVGGDVLPGPMPSETLARLLALDLPVHCLYGNGERAALAQLDASDPHNATYWGTTSGKPLPEPIRETIYWSAAQLTNGQRKTLRTWPSSVRLDVPGIGAVLFCHGTPRNETEVFTRLTREEPLIPLFSVLDVSLVVCGHTHMPFDRVIGGVRVVNAGSIGAPFGPPGADWLLLGPGVELRHTSYDLAAAADRVRTTDYPQALEFARSILSPPSEQEMLAVFTTASFA